MTPGVVSLVLSLLGEASVCRLASIDWRRSNVLVQKLRVRRQRRENRRMLANDRDVHVHPMWSLVSGGGMRGSLLGRVHDLQFYEQFESESEANPSDC